MGFFSKTYVQKIEQPLSQRKPRDLVCVSDFGYGTASPDLEIGREKLW